VFRSLRSGRGDLFQKKADGSGPEDSLYADELSKWPNSFSPDGTLAYFASADVWFLRAPLGPTGAPKPSQALHSPYSEAHPQFSPDGKWIAYESDEASNRDEIYIVPSTGQGKRVRISASGGVLPRWRENGRNCSTSAPTSD
jgi:Tol biopolymer transport system component